MQMNNLDTKSVSQFVDELQQRGVYSFERSELRQLRRTAAAKASALSRLVGKGRIARIRQKFYVIIPPEYRSTGVIPPSWFIDQLMQHLGLDYYVGLLSAAQLHGSAHQQPREFQVVTNKQLRPLKVGNSRIRFVVRTDISDVPTSNYKGYTGYFRVSVPEATACDLVRYHRVAGGFSNIATVLTQLAEGFDGMQLKDVAKVMLEQTEMQRLGYLTELAGAQSKTDILSSSLNLNELKYTGLKPSRRLSGFKRNSKWKIVLNQQIEVDL